MSVINCWNCLDFSALETVSNVVRRRECLRSFECKRVWVLIILYVLWEWKRKTIQGEKILPNDAFL